MKTFAVIAMCIASVCAFAGNKTTNAVAKATASNNNPVVYVYTKNGKAGIFYHRNGDCALKVRECIAGEKAGIATTKESNAKQMGAMACPSCGHKHEHTKSVASK